MKLLVAVDNSVLGDFVDPNIPENKSKDNEAFKKLVSLAQLGEIEIGIPVSGALIEEQGASPEKRKLLREKMGSAYKLWPVVVPNDKYASDLERKKECLHRIMQDKGGVDSAILLVSTIHTPYFITTDYRYLRNFKNQAKKIKKDCDINVVIFTPSEFYEKFTNGELQ